MAQLMKILPCRYENLYFFPRTKAKVWGVLLHSCEEDRDKENHWHSLARQSSLVRELQACELPCLGGGFCT